MSGLGVTTRGERELAVRFTEFPQRLRQKLAARITVLTDALELRVQAAEPYKTGALRGETRERVYTDQPERIAGYVSVTAEFVKAATLEYGTDKVRRRLAKGLTGRLLGRSLAQRISKPAHIAAFRYLRGPLEEMRPEAEAAIESVLVETVAETGG